MTNDEIFDILAKNNIVWGVITSNHKHPTRQLSVVVDISRTEVSYSVERGGETRMYGDVKEAIAAYNAPPLPPHIAPSIRSQSRRPDDDETTGATTA